MRSMIEYTVVSGKFDFGSRMRASVYATSAEVSGTPSCQRTPVRRWYVIVFPSALMPPFCLVGTSRARSGEGLPWSSITHSALKIASAR